MPGLERQKFIQVVDDMLTEAIATLIRAGTYHEVLYGFDPRAQLTTFVALPDPSAWTATDEATPVPSPMQNSIDQITQTFRTNRVQAAIHAAEAWYSHTEGTSLDEVFARLDVASAQDNRIELLMVHGYWPREYLRRAKFAAIQRSPSGAVTGAKEVDLGDLDPGVTLTVSWLDDVLPQPSHSSGGRHRG